MCKILQRQIWIPIDCGESGGAPFTWRCWFRLLGSRSSSSPALSPSAEDSGFSIPGMRIDGHLGMPQRKLFLNLPSMVAREPVTLSLFPPGRFRDFMRCRCAAADEDEDVERLSLPRGASPSRKWRLSRGIRTPGTRIHRPSIIPVK